MVMILKGLLLSLIICCSSSLASNDRLYQKFKFGDLEVQLLTNKQLSNCTLLNKSAPVKEMETCYNHKVGNVEYFWGTMRASSNVVAISGIYAHKNDETNLLLETLYSYIYKLNDKLYSISITQSFHEVFTRVDEIKYVNGEFILTNLETVPYPMLNYYNVPNGIIMVGFEIDSEQGWAIYFDGDIFVQLQPKGQLISK